jgi:hypothetical protein
VLYGRSVKKTNKNGKLLLKTETVRELSANQLHAVAGGTNIYGASAEVAPSRVGPSKDTQIQLNLNFAYVYGG